MSGEIHTWDRNYQWFDRYSVVHAAMGALFAASKVPAPLALGSHVAFELSENALKESRFVQRFFPDTRPDAWQNHTGDVASFAAGYFGAKRLKESSEGRVAVTVLTAAGAAIWMWNVLHEHSWRNE